MAIPVRITFGGTTDLETLCTVLEALNGLYARIDCEDGAYIGEIGRVTGWNLWMNKVVELEGSEQDSIPIETIVKVMIL